jgi:hypothetical protein
VRTSSYCGSKNARGWYCVLLKDHSGDHLSIDNQRIWEGSPGAPVWWPRAKPRGDGGGGKGGGVSPGPVQPLSAQSVLSERDESTDELDPTLTQGEYKQIHDAAQAVRDAQAKGYTGESCGSCGSLNTVRNGKCLLCLDCKTSGECG